MTRATAAAGGHWQARGLTRRYGALAALDGVDLDLAAGTVHALIGPNGAGKSTLIGVLAGALAPDAGHFACDGRAVTHGGMAAHVRAGIARSWQVSNLFGRLSALDNVALAVQAQRPHPLAPWRPRAADATLQDEARDVLATVGLATRAAVPAAALAHGEQRHLEIALALATRPRLLLLDEPMAGMGPDETEATVALIASLRGRMTVLLVEHDMDAVFRLADTVSVLVTGRVLASGPPAAIRADRAVRAAYLGEPVATAAALP